MHNFLRQRCFYDPGNLVTLSEFHRRLAAFDPAYQGTSGKLRIAKELPSKFPCGRHTANVRKIGNLSFVKPRYQSDLIVLKRGSRVIVRRADSLTDVASQLNDLAASMAALAKSLNECAATLLAPR